MLFFALLNVIWISIGDRADSSISLRRHMDRYLQIEQVNAQVLNVKEVIFSFGRACGGSKKGQTMAGWTILVQTSEDRTASSEMTADEMEAAEQSANRTNKAWMVTRDELVLLVRGRRIGGKSNCLRWTQDSCEHRVLWAPREQVVTDHPLSRLNSSSSR